MKQARKLALLLLLLATITFSTSATEKSEPKKPVDKEKQTIPDEDALIRMIHLYTVCPNGAIRAVGVIGLTDDGRYIDHYYWGEEIACENDQLVHYA